jgi:hypothetical protein
MKLQMKREALERINNYANEERKVLAQLWRSETGSWAELWLSFGLEARWKSDAWFKSVLDSGVR